MYHFLLVRRLYCYTLNRKMTELSFPTCDQYVECLQSGSGIPVHSGTIMQRGYGVGGLFRRLASGLLPLLPRIGKAVASTALGVVSDKMRGVPLSEVLKKRGLEAGKKRLFNRKPTKIKKTVKRRTRTVNKRIRKSDVFGSI